MFELVKIRKSEFGDGEVWEYKCSKCGHRESVSSSYGKKYVKCCKKCGEPAERVSNISSVVLGISKDDEVRLKKLRKRIIDKCKNENNQSYHKYKDTEICAEWLEDAKNFINWAINNNYKPWHRLYMIQESKGYTPENCYWASSKRKEQCLTGSDLSYINTELAEIGLDINTISKNIKEYRLSKTDLQKVIKIIQGNNNKNAIANKIDLLLTETQTMLNQVCVLEEAFNYSLGRQEFDNTKIKKVIAEINSIKKDI